jgi:glucuronate isomerase
MLTLFLSDPTDGRVGRNDVAALTDPDLLFPSEAHPRSLARDLYAAVKDLPIVSPHGHTDPRW